MPVQSLKLKNSLVSIALLLLLMPVPGCFTAAKLDKFVASEYNNELPKPRRKMKEGIEINSKTSGDNSSISTSVHKTDKFLPLLLYWKIDHRKTCSLNPSIAAVNFTNAINSSATKTLVDKLGDKKLELTIEQAPSAFSIVTKENMIWIIYVINWMKVYIEPDPADLVVSYRVLDGDNAVKAGTITVKNTEKNKKLRYFQSWKSATSEYLAEYNANFTSLAKSFLSQLTEEL